ncbi:unnamed protein product [Paramecium pentaurelia]|uniref:Uncharacterized protein n=1 Tax=Paramecium pentaurelia TaxID=43138 RepID=A0A8S1WL75_9CILI|nr:unnamed protein product [Paramecium pentaurelia]
MSVYRGFAAYDYGREYFAIFVRRNFETSQKWCEVRSELQKKLQEQKKKPENSFEMESEYGNFLCQFEKQTKCYFILLSNKNTIKEEQQKAMQTVIEQIKKVNNYIKLTREEFDQKLKQDILNILTKAEEEYIEKNGNLDQIMTQHSQEKKKFRKDLAQVIDKKTEHKQKAFELIEKIIIKHKNDDSGPPQKIIFKGFMMFDYIRQYFYMLINIGIPIMQKWINDRNAIQKLILDNQKKPQEIIQLKGEGGQFYAKYHKEKKCYFILYTDEFVNLIKQQEVLEQIYQLITPNDQYIKMNKEQIESKFSQQVKAILEQNEKVDTEQIVMKLEGDNNNYKQKNLSPEQQSDNNDPLKSNVTGSINNQPKNIMYQQDETKPLNQ